MGNGGLKYWNIWEGVLEGNGIDDKTGQILTLQGNLTNFHSQKYSGLTNSKVCILLLVDERKKLMSSLSVSTPTRMDRL